MTVAAPLEARALVPSSRLQAEHTAAYLNFLSRLPSRLSPSVVPFSSGGGSDEKKRKRGPFKHFDDRDGDDDERRLSSSCCSSSSCSSETIEAPLLPPPLPRHRSKATLVLDLDHTLVRSIALPAGRELGSDSSFEVCAGPGGPRSPTKTAFSRRPHLGVFLSRVSSLFEVVAFTAGSRAYAEPVLDALDPRNEVFAWRLYRDACVRVPVVSSATAATTTAEAKTSSPSVFVIKDLAKLGRPLSRTLIVDNSPTCFAYQVSNGVPVASWKGASSSSFSSPRSAEQEEAESDTALLDLLPLLERAAVAEDVRPLVVASFPAAAAAVAAARAHPSLFACFEAGDVDGAAAEAKKSAFAAACEAADKAAEEEARAAAAGDASSDESDATGLTTTTATAPLDLLLEAATTEETDDDDNGGSAAVSSPLPKGKKRSRTWSAVEGEQRGTDAAVVAVC